MINTYFYIFDIFKGTLSVSCCHRSNKHQLRDKFLTVLRIESLVGFMMYNKRWPVFQFDISSLPVCFSLCRRALAVVSDSWLQEQHRCLPPSWRFYEPLWAVRWATSTRPAHLSMTVIVLFPWVSLKACPALHSFMKATARLNAQLGAPCQCPGTGQQVKDQLAPVHSHVLQPMCKIYGNFFEPWNWTAWHYFVSAGHVGPPLPCNAVKLVDVAEMNYLAANGEGEVRSANQKHTVCIDKCIYLLWLFTLFFFQQTAFYRNM